MAPAHSFIKHSIRVLLLGGIVLTSCKSVQSNRSALQTNAPEVEATDKPFSLPGAKDSIFVLSANAIDVGSKQTATIYRLGEKITKIPVAHDFGTISSDQSIVIKSKFGKIYYTDGKGTIIVINGQTGVVENSVVVEGAIGDLEILSADVIYVGYPKKALVEKREVSSGKVLASVSLKGHGDDDTSSVDRLFIYEKNLLVGLTDPKQGKNTNLYVIDTAGDRFLQRIDLTGELVQENSDPETVHLWGPLFVPTYEPVRKKILLMGNNKRPRAGKGLWLDPVTFKLDKDVLHPGTFSGQYLFTKAKKGVKLAHTSTPTASTHPGIFSVEKDGTWGPFGEHQFDLFSHRDDLSMNKSETLVTLPNYCGGSVCTSGEGINFIDMANGTKLPKFYVKEMGAIALRSTFIID